MKREGRGEEGDLLGFALKGGWDEVSSIAEASEWDELREPDLVTVFFGHLPAARLLSLLEVSSVWMLDSVRNRREVGVAGGTGRLVGLPGQLSYSACAVGESQAEWLASLLEGVDQHHDGSLWTQWKRIDVVGLDPTPELQAVAREFGEVNTTDTGFSLSQVC